MLDKPFSTQCLLTPFSPGLPQLTLAGLVPGNLFVSPHGLEWQNPGSLLFSVDGFHFKIRFTSLFMYMWRAEEAIGSPGVGVTGGYGLLDVSAGNCTQPGSSARSLNG